jgi:hypothetical protein
MLRNPARLFFDAIARNKNKDQGECVFAFCPASGQSVAELPQAGFRTCWNGNLNYLKSKI